MPQERYEAKLASMLASSPQILEHSIKVFYLVRIVVDHLPEDLISRSHAQDLLMAAALHNLGKAKWNDEWFTEPSYHLRKTELTIMKSYTLQTTNTLRAIGFPYHNVLHILSRYNDRLDDRGYSLKEDSDLLPMILAACNVFAACTEERPYRKEPMTNEMALVEASKYAPKIIIDAIRTSIKEGLIKGK